MSKSQSPLLLGCMCWLCGIYRLPIIKHTGLYSSNGWISWNVHYTAIKLLVLKHSHRHSLSIDSFPRDEIELLQPRQGRLFTWFPHFEVPLFGPPVWDVLSPSGYYENTPLDPLFSIIGPTFGFRCSKVLAQMSLICFCMCTFPNSNGRPYLF